MHQQATQQLLVFDTGSPRVSVAVASMDRSAVREALTPRSSEALIQLLEGCLQEADLRLDETTGIIVLQGPGSFTGLRVGMAAGLALHQALGTPATAVPTLEAVSFTATHFPALCVADAQRGAWYCQLWDSAGVPAGPPIRRLATEPLPEAQSLIGYGAEVLAHSTAGSPSSPTYSHVREPEHLALRVAEACLDREVIWDPSRLTEPLYLSSAATTPPKRKTI